MNVTVNHSQDFTDMSNLSSISVIGTLNAVGAELRNNLVKMEKCLQDVNQSIKEILRSNQHESLLLVEKYKYGASIGNRNDNDILASQEGPPQKSEFFVEFEIQ